MLFRKASFVAAIILVGTMFVGIAPAFAQFVSKVFVIEGDNGQHIGSIDCSSGCTITDIGNGMTEIDTGNGDSYLVMDGQLYGAP
jgi:hypothetical protein